MIGCKRSGGVGYGIRAIRDTTDSVSKTEDKLIFNHSGFPRSKFNHLITFHSDISLISAISLTCSHGHTSTTMAISALVTVRPRLCSFRTSYKAIAMRHFNLSTTWRVYQNHNTTQDPNQPKPKRNAIPEPNPSYPAFNLNSLGLGKRMKIAVIIIVSIFGTIETWFWCTAIWRWWQGLGKPSKS